MQICVNVILLLIAKCQKCENHENMTFRRPRRSISTLRDPLGPPRGPSRDTPTKDPFFNGILQSLLRKYTKIIDFWSFWTILDPKSSIFVFWTLYDNIDVCFTCVFVVSPARTTQKSGFRVRFRSVLIVLFCVFHGKRAILP